MWKSGGSTLAVGAAALGVRFRVTFWIKCERNQTSSNSATTCVRGRWPPATPRPHAPDSRLPENFLVARARSVTGEDFGYDYFLQINTSVCAFGTCCVALDGCHCGLLCCRLHIQELRDRKAASSVTLGTVSALVLCLAFFKARPLLAGRECRNSLGNLV